MESHRDLSLFFAQTHLLVICTRLIYLAKLFGFTIRNFTSIEIVSKLPILFLLNLKYLYLVSHNSTYRRIDLNQIIVRVISPLGQKTITKGTFSEI